MIAKNMQYLTINIGIQGTRYFKENENKPYKIDIIFNDEYNEKLDNYPVRKLKIHENKNGKYIIHNHKRYYLTEIELNLVKR